jgi:hypothetical protein
MPNDVADDCSCQNPDKCTCGDFDPSDYEEPSSP